MFVISLISRLEDLRALGLVRSKRDYSRRWLGRGPTYLRDYEHRTGREMLHVAQKTVVTLRSRLCAVAACVPHQFALEILDIVDRIDRDCQTAKVLKRR